MWFQKKTVSSIVAGFNSMIDDLEAVATEMSGAAFVNEIEIDRLAAEVDEYRAEAADARAIRENILKIVQG